MFSNTLYRQTIGTAPLNKHVYLFKYFQLKQILMQYHMKELRFYLCFDSFGSLCFEMTVPMCTSHWWVDRLSSLYAQGYCYDGIEKGPAQAVAITQAAHSSLKYNYILIEMLYLISFFSANSNKHVFF